MSSDDYFSDDFDASLLNQVDAIEAAHLSPPNSPKRAHPTRSGPARPAPTAREDSDFDFSFDDYGDLEAELQRIEQNAFQKQASAAQEPKAGPSKKPLARTASRNTVQTTLFGDILYSQASSCQPQSTHRPPLQRVKSNSRNLFGKPPRKTKQWDHTAFAKTGWRKGSKSKGKNKFPGEEDEEDELVEFEQFPSPMVAYFHLSVVGPPPPMKLEADHLAMKTWIYPLNQPKRDYQFNIVRNSLFENTLVALPTGLGKTFIAGVVMLNFYHWFPDGKVIFVAPSKPLVAQQIDACHKTCGIPGSDAAELTGDIPQSTRSRQWDQKRVFYMTPQTLMNDLAMERCDPRDIILLVVDEAHKGTGDYAYAQVVRYMMAKNPHFRILALTATPGGKPEVVQEIVDSLHISRIEIRDENSIDLRGYMHKKITEQHKIVMHNDIVKIRTLMAKIMEEKIKPLRSNGILFGNLDPVTIQPFRCNMAMQEVSRRPDSRSLTWTYASLKLLGQLARAMGYLEISQGTAPTGKNGSSKQTQNSLQKHPVFQELIKELEAQYNRGLSVHPKMEKLKAIILSHFVKTGEEPVGKDETKVMVFVTYRECVDEIVEWLNQENPMIRATKFVGQGADKQGNKGFGQKEQLEIIRKFKAGEFNVLVATSVGEEGLDIGELDMVICYDVQSTPIRMLQRIGRTGRKRDGYVHVLVAESREEANWAKAKEKYEEVQQSIVRGEQLELFGDVERLLPNDVTPQCVEMKMDIQEYVRETKEKAAPAPDGGKSPSKGKKRKRDDDPLRNVPAGVVSGFVSVRDLIVKSAPKKRKKATVFDEHGGKDDDVDAEIEGGVFAPRRTASTPAVTSSPKPKTQKLRKTKTTADGPKATKTRKKAPKAPTLSQISQQGEDDSDDMEIERGLVISRRRSSRDISPLPGSSSPRTTSDSTRPDVPLAGVIELDGNDSPKWASASAVVGARNQPTVQRSSSPSEPLQEDFAFVDDDEDQLDTGANAPMSLSSPQEDDAAPQDMSWLLDDDDDDDDNNDEMHMQIVKSSPNRAVIDRARPDDGDISLSTPVKRYDLDPPTNLIQNSPSGQLGSFRRDMPPPPLPVRLQSTLEVSDAQELTAPEPSFAVRIPNRRRKRPVAAIEVDSSPITGPLARLRRPDATGPSTKDVPCVKHEGRKQSKDTRAHNPWVETEAAHSGEDSSEGESDDFEEVANESDLRFLEEPLETQVSPSYDQTTAYRQGLFTQAPAGARGPVFAHRPLKQGRFGPDRPLRSRQPMSSSPPREDDVPDEYAFGSFVVDDDAEISYYDDSSEL
ncbi:P-loop containing nucleoside triphosphate hydrolase protein [Neolentinus lepideus HHB14362 ss-1]|uniref:ATP-dependent DNA helicase n=1 Tax=Neolentinus lepideus HHB14362 ss-1 TaxID=1314782 RepID=A0A165PZA2_9AGAM|nr:P-loop containing nucleoside triphosphate hydrolase protein [Neolentinus lepideus HHB14362 ss-1]